jgi:hypothetical protein
MSVPGAQNGKPPPLNRFKGVFRTQTEYFPAPHVVGIAPRTHNGEAFQTTPPL